MSDRGGDHGVAERPDGAGAAPSGPVVTDPVGPPNRQPVPAATTPPGTKPAVAPGPTTPAPAAATPATKSPAAAPNTSFELWASRLTGGVPDLLRRVPFTATIVLGTLIVGLVARTVWSPIWRASWFAEVAYGTPALREGKIWTLLTGWWFYLTPGQYLSGLVMFAVIVGACEIRLGTRAVAITAIAGEIGGILLASLLVWALSATSWPWAQTLAGVRDVGFTTGTLTVLAVTTAALRSPWRLRVRAALWFYITVAFLFEGTLADVAHAIAVGIGFLVGQRLFGVEPGFGPRTRRETRMLAFGGLIAIGLTELVVLLFPGRGPFGSVAGMAGPTVDVVVDLVVIAVVANALRLGKRWAWWLTVGYGLLNLGAAALVLVLIFSGRLATGAPIVLGSALLWIGLLALIVLNRRAFRVPLRRRVPGGVAATEGDSSERARALLTSVGGSTMSWMTTWPEMRYCFLTDGRGYVGYERHAGVALALADPVAPHDTIADAVAEFTRRAEQGGLTPCLFSVTDAAADAARSAGWRTVQIAEDTIIDLPGLAFKGKKWQDVRSALNKAKRESITFRMTTLADEPFAVLAQVRAISEQWVGEKGLPEMGFTLGGVDEALDPAVKVGLALDPTGSIHGVTSWLPVYAPGGRVRGWTLDVMRRRDDGFRSVMEFMIASACLALKDDGAEFVSLSGAPLARSEQSGEELDRTDRLLDKLGASLEPFYGFRSLHAFKAKFAPRYEPIHLAFRDEADLPRIGVALTRAYLPDATPRQLLAAGLSANGEKDAP
jgi:phosphatidylglycerol lysyltransferase